MLDKSANADIIARIHNRILEVMMKNSIVIALLLAATPVLATVGGGDITLKNKGGM
jgi:hypothetical protein